MYDIYPLRFVSKWVRFLGISFTILCKILLIGVCQCLELHSVSSRTTLSHNAFITIHFDIQINTSCFVISAVFLFILFIIFEFK